MGILDWFRKRSKEKDAEAAEYAEETAFETDEEREAGDRLAQTADNVSARFYNEGSMDEVDRMSDPIDAERPPDYT